MFVRKVHRLFYNDKLKLDIGFSADLIVLTISCEQMVEFHQPFGQAEEMIIMSPTKGEGEGGTYWFQCGSHWCWRDKFLYPRYLLNQ